MTQNILQASIVPIVTFLVILNITFRICVEEQIDTQGVCISFNHAP